MYKRQSLGFARIPWGSTGFAGIREDSQAFIVIRKDSLGFASIPWHSPGFAGIRKYSLGFARIRWDSLRFVRIRLDLPGFLRIRWCCDSPNPQTSAARERSEGAERLSAYHRESQRILRNPIESSGIQANPNPGNASESQGIRLNRCQSWRILGTNKS